MAARLRFSIIIPAHNEGKYIEATLEHIAALSYPKDMYETIVVENGSSDITFDLAKKFESDTLRVFKSDKGSSRAKNLGIDHLSAQSDWVIFLDADTILGKEFLNELDRFLGAPNDFTVGAVSLRPLPESIKARIWFRFYDYGHILTKTSYSIKIVRRSLFPPIRFDETLTMGEDLDIIQRARHSGRYFFLWSRSVFTSTRRFEQLGWWYVFFYWTFVALLPQSIQRRFVYGTIR